MNSTHPLEILLNLAKEWKLDLYSEEFSLELDKQNIWPSNRHRFYYPKLKELPKGKFKFKKKRILFKYHS